MRRRRDELRREESRGRTDLVSTGSGDSEPDPRLEGAVAFEPRTPDSEPPLDDLPVHPLPDTPVHRRGPFGVSASLHVLAILLLVIQAVREARLSPPAKPPLTIEFQEPEPASETNHSEPVPFRQPVPAPRRETLPRSPDDARQPLVPPPPPKVLPPPTSLPPPKRMGEIVPVPHYPVPGNAPPESGKEGKPGAPAYSSEERRTNPGTPEGDNDVDAGISGTSGGTGPAGPGEGQGQGIIPGAPGGGLLVPKSGGSPAARDGAGSGGRRRGLDLAVPLDSGAFGDFSFESKDYDWSDYRSQMYWAILRAWYNRLYVMIPIFERWSYQNRVTRLRGTVLLRFVIERSGAVSTIEIMEPSIMPPLDESAQSALKEVILPRLPDDFTRQNEAVTGRFIMEIDDLNGWKMEMRYMKSRGQF